MQSCTQEAHAEDTFFCEEPADTEPLPAASHRTRRIAWFIILCSLAIAALAVAMLAVSPDSSIRRFASMFFGDLELGNTGRGDSHLPAGAGDPSDPGGASGEGITLAAATITPRRSLLVDDLSDGLEPQAASFVNEPRQVRQVRGQQGALDERSFNSRPRDRVRVRDRIRALGPAIQQCYERRMRTRGRLSGTLQVRFGVSASGSISNVSLQNGSLRDPDLFLCVRSRLSRMQLGRGAVETYSVPIRLVPSDEE